MSRHYLDTLSKDYTVVVGWDRRLDGYFADVVDNRIENRELAYVVDMMPTNDIVAIENAISPYVSPEVLKTGLCTIERDHLEDFLQPKGLSIVECEDGRTTTGTFTTYNDTFRHVAPVTMGRGWVRLIELDKIPDGFIFDGPVTVSTNNGALEINKQRDTSQEQEVSR